MENTPQLLFHFPGAPGGICFREPREVIRADDIADVAGALERVAAGVRGGLAAAGFLAYEAAPGFDSALKVRAASSFPLVWFGLFDSPVPFSVSSDFGAHGFGAWAPEITREQYGAAYARIERAICDGESYQVNGTFRLRTRFEGDALAAYLALHAAHPADYSAFVDIGDWAVLSHSPELLFELDGARAVTKPMKGTARRGRYLAEDILQADALAKSEKDRAENVMIVDLMRSDFGRIAKTGSVSAPSLFDIERLATVWQMTSTVTCDLPDGADFADLLRAVFPAGSVTGAPKASSMALIAETEHSPRGIYCGSIGYVLPDAKAVFNVAIRTVVIDKRTGDAECGVGGGITAGSVCDSEYAEAMAKSLFLTSVDEPFDLLETMRLVDGKYWLLDRHMNRLSDSAWYFGRSLDMQRVHGTLAELAAASPTGAWRVRLTVSIDGNPSADIAPLPGTAGDAHFVVAAEPIMVDSPFVFNKTTKRAHYDHFRKAVTGSVFDVLLWNESRQLTEFTTGNLVVKLDGTLVTPPIACGLLPGTQRAELLDRGEITERIVFKDDLPHCEEVWFINSLRGWVRL